MRQADQIRRHVLKHYIDPARSTEKVELTIRAGDVCRAMGLQGRAPNVCSVLGSRKLLDMGGLRLLDRVGPRQSTTTTFRYALVGPGIGASSASEGSGTCAEQSTGELRSVAESWRGRGENDKLTVVIACAGTKSPSAGHLAFGNGRPVKFIADPQAAPKSASMSYSRPDDMASSGLTWRQVLVEYNRDQAENPLGLLPAWRLYEPRSYPRVYSDLVEVYGLENIFILSAGWGLVAAEFLLPNYDITFAAGAESYKKRRPRDQYKDFAMLPTDTARPVVLLGGQDYVPLFCSLTRNVTARRVVFHYSASPPSAANCERRRFRAEDAVPRTWYYQCAYGLIQGDVRV